MERRTGVVVRRYRSVRRDRIRSIDVTARVRHRVAGLRVVLVYPIPEAGWNVPEELARRRADSDVPVTLSTPLAAYERRQAAVLAAFGQGRQVGGEATGAGAVAGS